MFANLHELGLVFYIIQWEVLKYLKDYFSNKKKGNTLNLVPYWPGLVVDVAKKNNLHQNINVKLI